MISGIVRIRRNNKKEEIRKKSLIPAPVGSRRCTQELVAARAIKLEGRARKVDCGEQKAVLKIVQAKDWQRGER